MSETQRFDTIAATWDEDPGRVRMAGAVAAAIAAHVPLSSSMDVLDFGCGTGLLTMMLRPSVGTVTGVDTSPGMLGMLTRKAADSGGGGVQTHQLTPDDGFAIPGVYDLIVSSMALHHVPELEPLFGRFRSALRPGGWVALADLDREDGTFHPPGITDVHHHGFERAWVRQRLEQAGFGQMGDTTAYLHERQGRQYPVFLVWAQAV